ncbi:MAG: hypothetical protein AAGF25_01235, partial [Pseudomonadota bacterium]
MSDDDIIDVEEEPKKPSLVGRLILPLILILAAGGSGFGFAKGYVEPMLAQDTAAMSAAMPAKEAKKADDEAEE